MPHRDWKFRIQDILDALDAIEKYTKGMEFKTFTEDRTLLKKILD